MSFYTLTNIPYTERTDQNVNDLTYCYDLLSVTVSRNIGIFLTKLQVLTQLFKLCGFKLECYNIAFSNILIHKIFFSSMKFIVKLQDKVLLPLVDFQVLNVEEERI